MTSLERAVSRGDIDLFIIALPNAQHEPAAIAPAQAGRNQVCAKPLGRNRREAEAMRRAAEESGAMHGYAETEAFAYGYQAELRHFVECMRNGEAPQETCRDGCIVNCILDAGYESMRTGKWMRAAS